MHYKMINLDRFTNKNNKEDKVNKEDKKAFNNLNKLIIDISNNKIEEKDAVERLEKSISDLKQLGKKTKD